VPSSRGIQLRRRLATIFEDDEPRSPATRLFNAMLVLLIVANVAAVVLESVDSIRHELSGVFTRFEHVATAIFAIEYVLRVWASVDFRGAPYGHPLWGRLRYMRSFFALVDLVAVLPAILGLLGAGDLRVLRLLRLLRMLKLVRHSTVFGLLWGVLREEARSIWALLFILLLTITISGALMYMLEGEDQPGIFTSIPAAMWWAVETITTVGYGDMVPVTVAGRILGGVISIVGIGTLALFSGLITVGFLDQLKTHRKQHAGSGGSDRGGQDSGGKLDQDIEDLGDRSCSGIMPAAKLGAATGSLAFGVCPRCGFAPPRSAGP
jgi:voltage-gated potassium channel